MIIAGTSFLIGAVFQASAKSTIALLFIGRVFWGVGTSVLLPGLSAVRAEFTLIHNLCCCLDSQVSALATIVPSSTQLRWLHPGEQQ